MCFCYVDSWLHKCHSGWTSGGLVNDSVRLELGGVQERGVSLREWDCKEEVKSLTSVFCTLTHWELMVGEHKFSAMTSPSFLMGQTHCKPAADLGPTGQAAVEEMGSATFLAARVAEVRSSPRQLGQPWQMLPLEGCWKFITKHISILGCSWLRFSGFADEALSLNKNTRLTECHNIHLLPSYHLLH